MSLDIHEQGSTPLAAPATHRTETRDPVRSAVLIDPQWLEAHLGDPNVRVVEVDVSARAYDQGHIAAAALWNIYADLKTPDYHPVDRRSIERLLARSDIHPDSVVVLYGYAPAMGFWLLRLYGHREVRILDCSRDAWLRDGRPWSTAMPPSGTAYPLPPEDRRIRASQSDVEAAVRDAATMIVDVRTAEEYLGERFWPSGALEPGGRAGHIPTAKHVPLDGLYDERGSFRTTDELRRVFSAVDVGGDGELITYCTVGGRATTAWFVLTQLLGREHVRVYDGSWAEWGRTPAAAVDRA